MFWRIVQICFQSFAYALRGTFLNSLFRRWILFSVWQTYFISCSDEELHSLLWRSFVLIVLKTVETSIQACFGFVVCCYSGCLAALPVLCTFIRSVLLTSYNDFAHRPSTHDKSISGWRRLYILDVINMG